MRQAHKAAYFTDAAHKALDRGGTLAPRLVIDNVYGDCSSPIYRDAEYRHGVRYSESGSDTRLAGFVEYYVRCRRCDNCLKHRARLWRARALAEVAAHPRTWFGTLTFAPEWRALVVMRADRDLRRDGLTLERIGPDERFKAIAASAGVEVTKYIKRVRKRYGSAVRYLLVFEAHRDGFPHVHFLMHQVSDTPLLWRHLDDAWTLGHSLFKLADKAHVGYVTKYLTKSMLARVRASSLYGRCVMQPDIPKAERNDPETAKRRRAVL